MMLPSSEQIERAKVALLRAFDMKRRWAYQRTFGPENGPLPRHIEIVLADLRDFCRAERSTFDTDPRISDLLQGRRDVWLRIVKYLALEEADVRKLVEVENE